MRLKYYSLFVFIAVIVSCSSPDPSKDAQLSKTKAPIEDISVDVMILKESSFAQQYVSNGKLTAARKSDLTFNTSGVIHRLEVKNGDRVKRGQVIAVLEQSEYRQTLRTTQTNFKKLQMELQDMLIGQGYDLQDSTQIPKGIFESAAIRSGYTTAEQELYDAQYQLGLTVLRAPFDGLVANLKQKVFEQLNSSEAFCTVIDASRFDVAFQLTEAEVFDIQLGDSISVFPISRAQAYRGVVSEINPVIDEFGLVQLQAAIKNSGDLLEGMNVKVIVEKYEPNKLVVPKEAVVLRQNQEVLFKYTKGKAYWTYVVTGMENSTSYTVQGNPDKGASLLVGDTVIVSDNLNLAHESNVSIR